MTDQDKLLSIMPALSRLNAWARLPYGELLDMHEMPSRIYGWKRGAIAAAIKLGIAELRIVAVERPCKTCKGTGTYEWQDWNDEDHVEYQACRRCTATGKVILRFVESRIGGFTWHTPRPRWDQGIFADDAWGRIAGTTDWTPEQPGAPLDRLELFRLINQVEVVVYEGRKPEARFGSATEYTLHLGELPGCWICGSINVRYAWDIWRGNIGLQWKAGLCDGCGDSAAAMCVEHSWPISLHRIREERDNWPVWHDRVPLPAVAHDPVVVEWLARRQIHFGRYFPHELAWTNGGLLVRVKSVTLDDHEVEVCDRYGYMDRDKWGRNIREYVGWLDEAVIRVKELRPTARNPYLPQFDWSEVNAGPLQDRESLPCHLASSARE